MRGRWRAKEKKIFLKERIPESTERRGKQREREEERVKRGKFSWSLRRLEEERDEDFGGRDGVLERFSRREAERFLEG